MVRDGLREEFEIESAHDLSQHVSNLLVCRRAVYYNSTRYTTLNILRFGSFSPAQNGRDHRGNFAEYAIERKLVPPSSGVFRQFGKGDFERF